VQEKDHKVLEAISNAVKEALEEERRLVVNYLYAINARDIAEDLIDLKYLVDMDPR